MKLLSKPECLDWCRERGIKVSTHEMLYYDTVRPNSLVSDLPTEGLRIIGLSNVLSRNLEGDNYPGALVWLDDYGIWSDDNEEAGVRLLSQLLSDPQRSACFPDTRGQVFDTTEVVDQRVALIVPMLFQWDAYLVPEHGRYFVFLSHDEYVNVVAKTEDELDRLFEELHAWNPTKKVPKRLR